jgi:hypothetical protein
MLDRARTLSEAVHVEAECHRRSPGMKPVPGVCSLQDCGYVLDRARTLPVAVSRVLREGVSPPWSVFKPVEKVEAELHLLVCS